MTLSLNKFPRTPTYVGMDKTYEQSLVTSDVVFNWKAIGMSEGYQ